MEALAAFLGAHALAMLGAATAVLLFAMAAFWLLVERCGETMLRGASRLSRAAVRRVPPLAGAAGIARSLGLEALAAFALSIGAFAAFVGLAAGVGFDEDLARFDEALAGALRAHLSPAELRVFAAVTRLGDFAFLAPLGVAVAVVLLWRGRWPLAALWAAATSLGGALNWVLKSIFERARPVHVHELVHADGWSFPSGHASGAMLVYGLLGYLGVRHAPRAWRLPVALAAAVLIVAVGFSRVMLQVHYLSDVLAGYASAAAWIAAWIAGLELARRREGR